MKQKFSEQHELFLFIKIFEKEFIWKSHQYQSVVELP
jgi:hypothetical protein